MTTRHRRICLTLLLTASGIMAGCSGSRDELPREPVSGAVTMDGQPLADGVIQFSPAAGSGAVPTSATALIEKGEFSIPRADGLVPGKYKVSISGIPVPRETRTKSNLGKKKVAPIKEPVPAKYNTQTTLTEEIKPGGATGLKYELQSK
jgi:hypothetical protein